MKALAVAKYPDSSPISREHQVAAVRFASTTHHVPEIQLHQRLAVDSLEVRPDENHGTRLLSRSTYRARSLLHDGACSLLPNW